MKFIRLTFFAFSLSPALASGENTTLTCPNSGEGSPQIALTLTADGGFELPKGQTMLLPITFDHAAIESSDPQKRVKLSCVYTNFLGGKEDVKKTVTLVAYTTPGALDCKLSSLGKGGKANQLVCKGK
jgi:hypothetical protein